MNRRIKVLIAEDEPIILRCIKKAIQDMGDSYEIMGMAFNGKEAFAIVLESKPDIVITDIKMPIMSGLELAEKIKKLNLDICIIILTGYESFAYARQAINIGAAQYLLKPVNFEQLQTSLEEQKVRILEKWNSDIRTYIRKNSLDDNKLVESNSFSMIQGYVLQVYWGSVGKWEYDNLHITKDIFRSLDFKFIVKIEQAESCKIEFFAGPCSNAYTFAVISDTKSEIPIQKIAEKLLIHLKSEEVFVNIFISRQIMNIGRIREASQELQIEACVLLIFGKSKVIRSEGILPDIAKTISTFIQKEVAQLQVTRTKRDLEKIIGNIIKQWRVMETTQHQMLTDLRYVIGQALQKSPLQHITVSDISELLYYSYSYSSLEQNLLFELGHILNIKENLQNRENKGMILSNKIKKYLDIHFTTQISFREMSRIFGYHENYITAIFKEHMGISPSKYVLQKRIEMAERLLIQREDMLLRDVAESVGYEDALYFSRVFKSSVGMSPSAYIKMHENKCKE